MTTPDRDELRNVFFTAWRKHKEHLPVEPLEAQIIELILSHPEYHEMLTHPETYQAADFAETNPFLHLSLHLAIREQISTNRPAGIVQVYENLCRSYQDYHVVEHKMLECLGQVLWDAQQSGRMPDEQYYLECLRRI